MDIDAANRGEVPDNRVVIFFEGEREDSLRDSFRLFGGGLSPHLIFPNIVEVFEREPLVGDTRVRLGDAAAGEDEESNLRGIT